MTDTVDPDLFAKLLTRFLKTRKPDIMLFLHGALPFILFKLKFWLRL